MIGHLYLHEIFYKLMILFIKVLKTVKNLFVKFGVHELRFSFTNH